MRVQRDRTGDSVAGVDVIVWGPVGQSGVQLKVQAAAVAHVTEPQRRSSIVDGWRGRCGSYIEIYMLFMRYSLILFLCQSRAVFEAIESNQPLCMIPLTRLEHT